MMAQYAKNGRLFLPRSQRRGAGVAMADGFSEARPQGIRQVRPKIKRLEDRGYELRRPEAAYLGDDIYELRAKKGHINHRILYFFHGQNVALLCHARTKERAISPADLVRAKARKAAFEKEPATHTASYRLKSD
jgi:phage-related protein